MYIHGDTLVMKSDSTFRDIKAYYQVRFYRSDIQGLCDSLHYSSRDSMVYLTGNRCCGMKTTRSWVTG